MRLVEENERDDEIEETEIVAELTPLPKCSVELSETFISETSKQSGH